MAEKKVTKRENFEAIKAILEEQGATDLVAVMEHEIELVSKKRNTQTKAQKANVELADKVYDILVDAGRAMSATEVFQAAQAEGLEVTSNQKATALLKILIEAKKVNKVLDGKKSTFIVAD